MNAHQIMEDVMSPLQRALILLEVGHVLVFLVILEMVSLVMVNIYILLLFFSF